MRISLIGDYNWESKIDHATKVADLRSVFESSDYGPGLSSLVICLNCRDPSLEHKQRVRFEKNGATLYVDVMLALPYFVHATHVERRKTIVDEVMAQTRQVLIDRHIARFETDSFLADLSLAMEDQFNGPLSSRFDKFVLEKATGY